MPKLRHDFLSGWLVRNAQQLGLIVFDFRFKHIFVGLYLK